MMAEAGKDGVIGAFSTPSRPRESESSRVTSESQFVGPRELETQSPSVVLTQSCSALREDHVPIPVIVNIRLK